MELGGSLLVEQKQTLSLGQVQSLNILVLNNQELENFLMNEYLENPMLENSSDKENEMFTDLEKMYEKGSSFREQYLNNPEEEEKSRNDVQAKTENFLKEYLQNQLDRSSCTDRTWEIYEYLIDCLDDKGYFTYETEELAENSGYLKEELDSCLETLKELEPVGIFSANLAECLEKQLRVNGVEDEKLFELLRNYILELMNGQIGTISRKLGISTVQVKAYIHLIGSLNPRPVMDIQKDDTEYVVPDILISRQGEQWEVTLNDGWMGEYRYNDYYIHMMEKSQDPELQAYFKERLERAHFVVNSVEQRRKTIIRIVETVLELQKAYFEGTGGLVPMQQEDVAQILGIHVSTVSRAIKGKYIQYRKTIPVKSLFTVGVSENSGENGISSDVIKKRICQLIAEEGEKSLSDQKLAEQLELEGITISRRAVAKYRIQMNIPDSRQRAMLK